MKTLDVTASIQMSPGIVAAAFWAMASDEQADFFAELERIAGTSLCQQMAGVVNELYSRASDGDRQGLHGFKTMFSHAAAYSVSAADLGAWDALRAISSLATAAKVQP